MLDRPDETTGRPRCHWVREPDGVQWLVPGCMTRMFEPDVDGCDCLLLADELAAARTRPQSVQDAYDSLRAWTDHIISAVGDHRDGKEIMKAVAGRALGPVARGSTN